MRLQDLNSLDMGNRLHSATTMCNMVVCCAELWLGDLKDFLQQPHPITGRRPYVGTMVDKVTDNSTKRFPLQVQSSHTEKCWSAAAFSVQTNKAVPSPLRLRARGC